MSTAEVVNMSCLFFSSHYQKPILDMTSYESYNEKIIDFG